MADGTTIKDYWIARIHRSNFKATREELERMIDMSKDQLKAMVCTTPRDTTDEFGNTINWEQDAINSVNEIIDEICEDYHKLAMVEYCIENPSDIIDDYDEVE